MVDLKNVHLHWILLAMNKLCYEGGKKIHISLAQLNIDLIPCINILFAAEINNYLFCFVLFFLFFTTYAVKEHV